jgi:hypothetical protein
VQASAATRSPAVAASKADAPKADAPKADAPPPVVGARHPGAPRVVAIGDVHGDLQATRDVLQLAGAIDANDRWIGGKLVVVQTGDQLDRGDDERGILDLLDALREQATKAGGALHVLNGNHELMNAQGDFRYVTPGAIGDFRDEHAATPSLAPAGAGRMPAELADRAAAFLPGGKYAKLLGARQTIAIVGDTVFAHGGVHLKHVKYGIDRLNAEVSAWLDGSGREPAIVLAQDGPVWSRDFGLPVPSASACAELGQVLALLGVRRMVVGHTVQETGITPGCGERVWRIDVGMSSYYKGREVMALQIDSDQVRILRRAKTPR